jgi:hypothetical protein
LASTTVEPTQLLREHAAGSSFRALGKRYGLSHEKARQMVSEAIDTLAFDAIIRLYGAWRDEQNGATAEWPGFVIPHQAQPDRQIALGIFQAVTDRLRARGVPLKVVTRHVPVGASVGGTIHLWTIDEDENNRREAAKEN